VINVSEKRKIFYNKIVIKNQVLRLDSRRAKLLWEVLMFFKIDATIQSD